MEVRWPSSLENLNAFTERFLRSKKRECLTKMIFVGPGAVRRSLAEYMTQFHEERSHQGREYRLIRELPAVAANGASIRRRTLFGGMLTDAHRCAA